MWTEGAAFAAGACVPAVLLAVLVARRRASTSSPYGGHEAACALLLLIAFVLGHVAVAGTPNWRDWEHQPFWVAVTLSVISFTLLGKASRWAAPLLAAVSLAALAVWPGTSAEWPAAVPRGVAVATLSLGSYVLTASSTKLAPRLGYAESPAILGIALAGVGVLCYLAGYAKFALLAAATGGILLPASLVSLFAKKRLPASIHLATTTLFLAILLGGWFHTLADQRPPVVSFLLLGTSPLAARVGHLKCFTGRPRAAAAARTGLVALVALAGVLVAFLGGGDPEAGSEEHDWDW